MTRTKEYKVTGWPLVTAFSVMIGLGILDVIERMVEVVF